MSVDSLRRPPGRAVGELIRFCDCVVEDLLFSPSLGLPSLFVVGAGLRAELTVLEKI